MNDPLIYLTMVLGLGIVAQWLAWRFRLPSILLLLAFGFTAGLFFDFNIDSVLSGGTGELTSQVEKFLLSAVGLSVAIILFEGGLTLKFSELKESGSPVLRLCSVGVAVSFVLTTAFCMFVLGQKWQVAALLGSILVVTGPTVIAPLLRHIQPSRKIGSIVKWEGIVVDPIGAILAVLVFQAALAGDVQVAKQHALYSLGITLLVGVVMAYVLAKIIELLLKHHLIPDFLHSVFLLAVVAVAFTVSNKIQHESGLLTVTVLGITLANQKSVSVKHILEFKENLRTLIISCLFIVLSGRIEGSRLLGALGPGLLLLAALIIIIRPLSVFIANLFSKKTSTKEQFFLACLAPRGIVAAAVTSIFALELSHAYSAGKVSKEIADQANQLEPLIFIVIIGTVAFYGLLAAPLARRLGISKQNPTGILFAGAEPWSRLAARTLHEDGHDILMLDTNYSHIASATVEGIPAQRANILSEFVEEELELTGLGHLMAATPNDEVNSLAAKEFTHIFGSSNVWQVAPIDDEDHHTTAVAAHMRGRICFPGRPTHEMLNEFADSGAVMKKTTLSEQFTFEDFTELYLHRAIILFLDSPERGLRPAAHDLKKVPSGTSIYALTIPQSEYDPDVHGGLLEGEEELLQAAKDDQDKE